MNHFMPHAMPQPNVRPVPAFSMHPNPAEMAAAAYGMGVLQANVYECFSPLIFCFCFCSFSVFLPVPCHPHLI